LHTIVSVSSFIVGGSIHMELPGTPVLDRIGGKARIVINHENVVVAVRV
jgi:hypothetical protein